MKLYQFPLSPNCQKVVALAYEVAVPLELAMVDLFKGQARAPELLAKNPNGRLPILEDGSFVLWESNAMLGYIAAKAERTDLAPTAPRERADVDRWLHWQNAHFGPAIRKVAFERVVKKLGNLGAPDEVLIRQGSEEFEVLAKVLDQELATREYVCGRLTIADFALATYAALAASCGLDFGPHAKASAWLERMAARESMRKMLAQARGAQ
jgi:glutathione S-transferase